MPQNVGYYNIFIDFKSSCFLLQYYTLLLKKEEFINVCYIYIYITYLKPNGFPICVPHKLLYVCIYIPMNLIAQIKNSY